MSETSAAPATLPNLVGFAIDYSRRGWPVFPLHTALGDGKCSCGLDCKKPGKHPRTKHGFKDATVDQQQIRQWWKQWPDAPIAIATGAASSMLVVDIDPRSGGDKTWWRLVNEHGLPPAGLVVTTGSGGSHYYMRAPGYPVKSKAGALGKGVDVKCDGGYVVAPPSLHDSGARYSWNPGCTPGDVDPEEAPAWLLAKLERGRSPGARGKRGDPPDSKLAAAFAAADMLGKRLADGRWPCRCPWEDEHTGGKLFDTSTIILPATSEYPRARWLCSHGHCTGRDTAAALAALPPAALAAAERDWAKRANDPPKQAEPAGADWRADLLTKGDSGEVRACETNAIAILCHDERLAGKLSWDAFACRLCWSGEPPWGDDERPSALLPTWQDEDATRLQAWLHRSWGVRLAATALHAVAHVVGRRAERHPVREWLSGLRWDATVRLDHWLATYLGALDTDFAQAVGVRWMISAVARVMQPGCQVDHMLVLEGPQGRRKSTALRTLTGPAWYTDRISDPGVKDSAEELPGMWIAEYSDLATLRRADVEAIKAFITRRSDRYRPSYGRSIVEQPRQCVFAATTNESTYLADPTGGRRFWPVSVGTINIAALERDREQLWAEAYARFSSGESWWLEDDAHVALATEEQDRRYTGDPWELPALTWLARPEVQHRFAEQGGVTTVDVLLALDVEVPKQDRTCQMRVAALLKRAGWGRERKRCGGVRTYVYSPPLATECDPEAGDPNGHPPEVGTDVATENQWVTEDEQEDSGR